MSDKQDSKVKKNTKDSKANGTESTSSNDSSYTVKYNTRKSSTNSSNHPDSSSLENSYAQLHKSKSAKGYSAGSLSSKTIKGGSLGPITNGYSQIYKKGTLGGRPLNDYSRDLDSNNNHSRPLGKNYSPGAKSLSPFDSRLAKSPVEKSKQGTGILGMKNTSLSASLPDWSELPSRPRKLLSPVSPSK